MARNEKGTSAEPQRRPGERRVLKQEVIAPSPKRPPPKFEGEETLPVPKPPPPVCPISEEEKNRRIAEWQAKFREEQKAKESPEATSSGGAATSSGGPETSSKKQDQGSTEAERPLLKAADCKSADDWNKRIKQQEALKLELRDLEETHERKKERVVQKKDQ